MTRLVVDASVVVKWIVDEEGTVDALALRRAAKLIAPDLLVAECADVLWKKVAREEFSRDEAVLAAGLLARADIELLPTRALLEPATRLAIELRHPAYDCIYLALAIREAVPLVTADARFRRVAAACGRGEVLTLAAAGSNARSADD